MNKHTKKIMVYAAVLVSKLEHRQI